MPSGVEVFSSMTLPIQFVEMDDGLQLMVEAMVNGKAALMMVDTGASRTLFDPAALTDYIEEPKYEKMFATAASIGGTDIEQNTVVVDSFSLGDAVLKGWEFVAIDLWRIRDFNRSMGLPDFVGIIGGDVLRHLKATISYGRRTLTVRKPRKM